MNKATELIERLRTTASKGVSVWGDLQMEAANEIEILTAEREAYANAMDRIKVALEAKPKQIEAKEKLVTPSDNVRQMLVMLTTENKTQAKKIEELQADADRWRTFRSFFVEEPPNAIAAQIERANTPEELDAAIDAARKGETE